MRMATGIARIGRPLTGLIFGILLALLAGFIVFAAREVGVSVGSPTRPPLSPPTDEWQPGAAGAGVASGEFGAWRNSPVTVAGSWSDVDADSQLSLTQLDPGGEFDNWTGSLDLAVGAIFEDAGETWSAAAEGAYDERWRELLTNLEEKWTKKDRGTLFIRFAHEWNGDWSLWTVDAANLHQFVTAWRRFYDLKQSLMPEAKLVFNTNGDTTGQEYDWRDGWPGDSYVDVYSTDWYSNHYLEGKKLDAYGGPVGLEQHRLFAEAHHKPFAISEWGVNFESGGDQPRYVQFMHDFAQENGGNGPGQLLYDVYFNVIWTPNQFGIFPQSETLVPESAAKYQQLY